MNTDKKVSGKKLAVFWPLAVLLLCIATASGRQSPVQAGVGAVQQEFPEYRVGPGDLLSIRVFGLDQFDQTARISNSGKIHVRYIGVLRVADTTVGQIEQEIARELRERGLVKEPWVRVQVEEYNAQPVFVIGEVNSPGQIMITGEMHLVDVITKAGGFRPSAAEEAFLIRRGGHYRSAIEAIRQGSENPSEEASQSGARPPEAAGGASAEAAESGTRIKINIPQLSDGSRPELNVRVQGGDVFYVPTMRQQVIYIIGEVKFPGAYVLPRYYDHITATRALAYAGGTLRRSAKTNKAFIVRYDKNGAIRPIPFDISASIKGKQPDIPMMPNDIIFVPRSVAKMTGYKLLDMTAHMTHQFVIF